MKFYTLLYSVVALLLPVITEATTSANAYGTNWYADTQNATYDGYQQAWRYLGHMIKCGYPTARYYQQDSHSHDSGDNGNNYVGNNWCQRYLMWAAYVDTSYSGGGIGEYYYYDTNDGDWDYSACSAHGNGRCAPMDCHLDNSTTWQLMGVYKEASYFGNDAFFEQLFKHEGYCVWNDEDLYDFMSEARESSWPEGCVEYGNGLYFDFKPTYNGNMTYGLYTDQICKTEYTGSSYTAETIAKNMGLLYGSYLDLWNAGLEPYKVCQPCRAYNLQNQYSATGIYNSGSSNYNNRERNLDGDYDAYSDPNDGFFQCADDADYTNVNQCMKFRSHADLEAATWEDLVIATEQKGILPVTVGGETFGTEKMSPQQQQYLAAMEEAKLRQEEAEYAALVASVPSATPILRAGSMMEWLGMTFLGLVLVWMLFRCMNDITVASSNRRDTRNYGTYKEPLNPNEVYNQEQVSAAGAPQEDVPQDDGIDQQRSTSPQDLYEQARGSSLEGGQPEWVTDNTPDQPTSFEQDMVHVTAPSPVPGSEQDYQQENELPRGTPA